ncbi:MAG: SAM-dependent methyltransferase, partial [Acidimicrobiia bacterium]
MTLVARLRERIAASGPLPFDEFMETCLYDPADGFFTTGPLRSSTGGDFLTSPEVSPWFGRTLGRFVAAEQARLAPHAVTLIEAGAGSGSLLAPLLDERDGAVSGEVWAVEASPAARAALAQILPPPRVVDTMGALPRSLHGVVIANELLDNLPVALASRQQDGWAELRVTVSGDSLA